MGEPLLLLHAGIADGRMWQRQMDKLCKQHFVIAPDLRGYGQTPLPDGPFSYLKDLTETLDQHKIQKTWIVGASFGSRLGLSYYLRHPERVKGLVLISPILSGFSPSEEIRAFNQKEDDLLATGELQEATELNLRFWVDGPNRSEDDVDREVRLQIQAMQHQAFQNPVPAGARVEEAETNAMDRLGEIVCPVLIVTGDQDHAAVLDHAQLAAQGIPGAVIQVVSEAGHIVNMEKPEKINSLLEEFILNR
jgi:pimeloyl-ACP methyl ester carboxylesterase